MLQEFSNLRQHKEGYRRLFSDEYFELYVWYDRQGGSPIGFQLVYDKARDPHALTWTAEQGYQHNRIDEGEDSLFSNMTPILVPDGAFDRAGVAERFERAAGGLEAALRDLVLGRLSAMAPR